MDYPGEPDVTTAASIALRGHDHIHGTCDGSAPKPGVIPLPVPFHPGTQGYALP